MNTKRLRYWTIAASFIALFSIYSVKYFSGVDFYVYYAAGQSLLSGRTDLYSPDFALGPTMDYRYPPLFLLLFVPLALLPQTSAAFLWNALTLTVMGATFVFFKRTFSELQGWPARINLIFTLAVLLNLKYILISIKTSNVHTLVICFFAASFCLLIREKTLYASALYALTISIKIFPIFAFPYFALKRAWRYLLLTVAFSAFLLVVPSIYFGVRENLDLHQQWFDHVITPTEFVELNGPPNQSLVGLIERYFTEIPYEDRIGDRGYQNVNIANLYPATARAIGLGTAAFVVIATYLLLFFTSRDRKERRWGEYTFHEFGLVITMILLAGPRTNHPYFIAFLIPVAALLVTLFKDRSPAAIIGTTATAVATVILPLVPGAQAQRLFLVLAVDTIAAIVVWIALFWILLRSKLRPVHFP